MPSRPIPENTHIPTTSPADGSAVDTEVEALASVGRAISKLPADAAERVLRYFLERLGRSSTGVAEVVNEMVARPAERFRDFVTFYDDTDPRSGPERALVAAYWFQEIVGNPDWDSQTINTELRNLGHPSSNITADLKSLSQRTPRLVLQVSKSGTSAPARKRYKLTREGVRAVQSMMRKDEKI